MSCSHPRGGAVVKRAGAAAVLALALAATPSVAFGAPAPAAPPAAPVAAPVADAPVAVDRETLGSVRTLEQNARKAADREPASAPRPKAVVGNALRPGDRLAPGDSLESPSGRWSLVLDADGVLTLSKAPNRLNPQAYEVPFLFESGTELVLQEDGNLVLYGEGGPEFATGTAGQEVDGLFMQDDGNVVLYGPDGPLYVFESPLEGLLTSGATLLPGEALVGEDPRTVLVMQEDGNLVLYTDGRPRFATLTFSRGAAAVVQADGNVVVYPTDGAPLFATGTATGAPVTLLAVSDREFRVVQFADAEDEESPLSIVFGSAWGTNVVEPGMFLLPGDRRRAAGGVELVMQEDGNLVQYVRGRAVFATGTEAFVGIMQEDGNFVLYGVDEDGEAGAVFQTRTGRNPGAALYTQSDGNVVVYTAKGQPVYSALRRR